MNKLLLPALCIPDAAPLGSAPDAEQLYLSLKASILAALQNPAELSLVGIHSGGAWIAKRLARDLGIPDERLGFLDVSFYRDDFARKGLRADVKPSQIGFDVNGASVLLVDDVLYTGRTTRAAINELFDYGRPLCVRLAALVDRGERELPIRADFVALTTTLAPGDSLSLQQAEDGTFTLNIQHV